MVSFVLPTESSYLETMNRAISSAIETGLMTKFYSDVEWMIYPSAGRALLQVC